LKNFEEESLIEDAKDLKLLYVESNKEIKDNFSDILNKYFKKVVSTPYADNAIKLFSSDFFDIVIINSELSDMEAEKLGFKIKHVAPRKPILLVSEKHDIDKIISLVNIGIAGYIKYPFDKKEVIKILAKNVNEIIDLKMMYSYQDSLEVKEVVDIEEESVNDSELLLTKRYSKISAKEFLDRYPIDLSSSTNSILDVSEYLDIHLNTFMNNPTKENIEILANEFEKFSSILENIEEFNDMAFVANKLSIIIMGLEENKDYKQYSDIFLALSASLNKWFEDIFINKTAEDIHFLDHSMLGDALTLEDLFRSGDISEDDGVEFF
jgi:DNA-binding response OmpR family regulator